MLDGVDSPVDNLDRLVENHEGCLQTGKLDQSFNCSGICFPASLDLLTTFTQTSQLEVVDVFLNDALKLRQKDTRDVLLFRPYTKTGVLDGLLYLKANVSSGSVCYLS